jgi:hypothetical protein
MSIDGYIEGPNGEMDWMVGTGMMTNSKIAYLN